MDQNSSQNQNQSFFQKNQTYIIGAVIIIVVALIIYFAARGDQNQNDTDDQAENQTTEESTDESVDQNTNETENQEENQDSMDDQPADTSDDQAPESGNVTARGTLRASDAPEKGNLMIEGTSAGKVYLQTIRDYTALLDKEVDLEADGTIQSFVLLGLSQAEATTPPVASDDGGAVGGAKEEEPQRNVSFSGRLQNSDDTARGNFIITSSTTKVYLQTVRDYSGLLDQEVDLMASGTIQSFTNAVLTKK